MDSEAGWKRWIVKAGQYQCSGLGVSQPKSVYTSPSPRSKRSAVIHIEHLVRFRPVITTKTSHQANNTFSSVPFVTFFLHLAYMFEPLSASP